jgi:hypothetical protein
MSPKLTAALALREIYRDLCNGSPGMRLLRTERAPSTADARSERETDGAGNEAWRFGVVNRSNRKNKEQTTAALGVARRFRHPPDEGELS